MGLTIEHDPDRVTQGLHDFGVVLDFAGIHKVPRLNFHPERLQLSDSLFQLFHCFSGVVTRQQSAVEHDPAFALNGMRGLWEAFDGVGGQTHLSQLRVGFFFRIGHQGLQFLHDLHGPLYGVHPLPRPAAVRLFSAHGNQNIHAPFVSQLNLRRTIDDPPIRLHIAIFQHLGKRIVTTCFTGRAGDEIEISGKLRFTGTD